MYPQGQNTKRNKRREYPAEVLEQDTLFLVFNGNNHYWAVIRDEAAPSISILEQQRVTIEVAAAQLKP